MTPRQLAIEARAIRRRAQEDLEREMFIVWHGAAFGRIKRIPSLESVLRGMRPGAQTMDEQIAIAKHVTAVVNANTST